MAKSNLAQRNPQQGQYQGGADPQMQQRMQSQYQAPLVGDTQPPTAPWERQQYQNSYGSPRMRGMGQGQGQGMQMRRGWQDGLPPGMENRPEGMGMPQGMPQRLGQEGSPMAAALRQGAPMHQPGMTPPAPTPAPAPVPQMAAPAPAPRMGIPSQSQLTGATPYGGGYGQPGISKRV